MSARLLVIALRATADGLKAQSHDAFERSRKLRERMDGEGWKGEDDYELGYAEGRSSALGGAATKLDELAASLTEATV